VGDRIASALRVDSGRFALDRRVITQRDWRSEMIATSSNDRPAQRTAAQARANETFATVGIATDHDQHTREASSVIERLEEKRGDQWTDPMVTQSERGRSEPDRRRRNRCAPRVDPRL